MIKKYFDKTGKYLNHDIWEIDHRIYGRWKARRLRYLKVLLLTIRGMSVHKVGLYAAALTFFSLIAIVPFIAVVYAITRGFGFAGELEAMIYANFSGQEAMLQRVLGFGTDPHGTTRCTHEGAPPRKKPGAVHP